MSVYGDWEAQGPTDQTLDEFIAKRKTVTEGKMMNIYQEGAKRVMEGVIKPTLTDREKLETLLAEMDVEVSSCTPNTMTLRPGVNKVEGDDMSFYCSFTFNEDGSLREVYIGE